MMNDYVFRIPFDAFILELAHAQLRHRIKGQIGAFRQPMRFHLTSTAPTHDYP